jgi:hypothetical protein
MSKILKYEEIKNNQYLEYSESYEVKFWIQDGKFWKQKTEMYFGKTKGEHEYVFNRWKKDYNGQNVKYISANGSRLCEGKGLEALNFKLSTND